MDIEVGELESEMTGMRRAIWENRGEESQDGDGIIDKQDGEGVDDEADDMKVVELQNMMLKMQAVKGQSLCSTNVPSHLFSLCPDLWENGSNMACNLR